MLLRVLRSQGNQWAPNVRTGRRAADTRETRRKPCFRHPGVIGELAEASQVYIGEMVKVHRPQIEGKSALS